MKPQKYTYVLTALDADGIAATQTPSGAGNLTLDGVLASGGVATFTAPQRVTITSAGNDTGRTFTVYGTDYGNNAISEAITGASGGAATSAYSFLTVTRIAVDDATAGAVTAGINGAGEMPWIPLDHHAQQFQYAYNVDIGTATFTVESTLDEVQTIGYTTPATATVEASGSSDVSGSSTVPCTAIRVKVTAFTTGNIVFRLLQTGK